MKTSCISISPYKKKNWRISRPHQLSRNSKVKNLEILNQEIQIFRMYILYNVEEIQKFNFNPEFKSRKRSEILNLGKNIEIQKFNFYKNP